MGRHEGVDGRTDAINRFVEHHQLGSGIHRIAVGITIKALAEISGVDLDPCRGGLHPFGQLLQS